MTAGILLIAIPGGLALASAYGTLTAAAGLATGVIPTASAIIGRDDGPGPSCEHQACVTRPP